MGERGHAYAASMYLAVALLIAVFNDWNSVGFGLFVGMATVHGFEWSRSRREAVREGNE